MMRKQAVGWMIVGVLALLLSIPAQAQTPYEFYVTVEGEQQGRFKEKIIGVRFQYDVHMPRDPQSNQPSGRRIHSPVVITKQWGRSSPQFFLALTTGEHLRTVLINFVRTGQSSPYQVMTLQDAIVVSLRQYANTLGLADPLANTRSPELEDITLTFQRITITNYETKNPTSWTDSWDPPAY